MVTVSRDIMGQILDEVREPTPNSVAKARLKLDQLAVTRRLPLGIKLEKDTSVPVNFRKEAHELCHSLGLYQNDTRTDYEQTAPLLGDWISPANGTKKIILYLHGGAYCICSSKSHRNLCLQLAKESNAQVFGTHHK